MKQQKNSQTKPAFLKLRSVELVTCVKKTQLYDLGNRNLAPRPIKLSARSSAWIASEIDEWIELLKEGKTWADRGEV